MGMGAFPQLYAHAEQRVDDARKRQRESESIKTKAIKRFIELQQQFADIDTFREVEIA